MRRLMRPRVSVSRHVSRHRSHLWKPPDFVPALGPRHFPPQPVHSCREQSCRSVIRRRRKPQKGPRQRIALVKVRHQGFRLLHVQSGGGVHSRAQHRNTISAALLHRLPRLRARQRRQRASDLARNPGIRHRLTAKLSGTVCARAGDTSGASNTTHSKNSDAILKGTSRDFHAVRIARTVPARVTRRKFLAERNFAGRTEFRDSLNRNRSTPGPTMNRNPLSQSRNGAFRRSTN